MFEAIERVEIAAPPDRVWAIVADVAGHARLAGSGEVRAIRIDAPVARGTTFEGEIAVGVVGTFVSRNVIEELDPPRRISWRSYPPLDDDETPDHQIEVEWWFALERSAIGTVVEHGFRAPLPKAGADEFRAFVERTDRVATVRAGMVRTLANLADALA